jgi:futalosine hydrolase
VNKGGVTDTTTEGILLVAATEAELCGHRGLVCGIGPVEAAAATSRALSDEAPRAVLHVGIAGGRRIAPGSIVIGSEAVYCDLAAEVPVVTRVEADPGLVAAAQRALPEAVAIPIGTSAVVDGPCGALPGVRVEGMEGYGVLRACALVGVPAVEVRAVSNQIGEGDRARWQVARALEALAAALPGLLAELAE